MLNEFSLGQLFQRKNNLSPGNTTGFWTTGERYLDGAFHGAQDIKNNSIFQYDIGDYRVMI
jgi:hypothetical protein